MAAPAFAAEGVDMQATIPASSWAGVELTWNTTADKFGDYTVQIGDEFMLDSAADAFGDPVSMSNLTVAYVMGAGASIDWNGTSENTASVTAETPKASTGVAVAVVINGRVDLDGVANLGQLKTAMNGAQHKDQDFTIAAKSLEGAFAYQGDDTADISFKYTGYNYNDGDGNDIHFADAAGKKLVENTDYTVKLLDSNGNSVAVLGHAGDCTAVLTGIKDYAGSTETAEFTIDP
ncbi:hypothetical protein [Enorma phocaeensis]|uniref:Uncharacterized protein n=1 Tax=Enorma phocaeensis TaxID=1871019 RepID=A0ABT7VBG4_9ACTN|nr:hypothetical protein [Enorma phocaeensis]MDM8275831.1 hypothetical protein [Enorma phocaeensis]